MSEGFAAASEQSLAIHQAFAEEEKLVKEGKEKEQRSRKAEQVREGRDRSQIERRKEGRE